MALHRYLAFFLCVIASSQTVTLVPVVSKSVSRTTELPGEILPYLSVPLHARVPGYVEKIAVDRGSAVDAGQVLVELSAPELKAQIAAAESKVQEAESERAQAEASSPEPRAPRSDCRRRRRHHARSREMS